MLQAIFVAMRFPDQTQVQGRRPRDAPILNRRSRANRLDNHACPNRPSGAVKAAPCGYGIGCNPGKQRRPVMKKSAKSAPKVRTASGERRPKIARHVPKVRMGSGELSLRIVKHLK